MRRSKLFYAAVVLFFMLSSAPAFASQKNDNSFGSEKVINYLERKFRKLSEPSTGFIIGYTKFKMGKYKEAENFLRGVVGKLPMIEDYVKYFLGESCLRSKASECAITNLNDVVRNYPDSVFKYDASRSLAEAYLAAGDPENAGRTLSLIEPDAAKGFGDDEYDLLRARISAAAGKVPAAVSILRGVYFDAGSADTQEEALSELKGLSVPEAEEAIKAMGSYSSRLELSQRMVRNYRFDDGIKILEGLSGNGDAHLKEILADAYFRARDYSKAEALYRELVSMGRGATFYRLRLAKSAARTDDFKTAVDVYKRLLNGNPKGSLAALYKYKLAFLYMDSHHYRDALNAFLEMKDERGYLRKNILWKIAWCYYKLGKLREAADYFKMVANSGFGSDWKTRALYWLAVCHDRLGEKDAAKSIWRDIIGDSPFRYYGFLSAEKLYGRLAVPNDWKVCAGNKEPAVNDASRLPDGLSKAKYLSDLGLHNLAYLELERFDKTYFPSADEAVSFMRFAEANKDFRAAYTTTINNFKPLLDRFPCNKNGLRYFAWQNWFLKAYPSIVERFASSFGVDKLLAFSIIREESRYQPFVISSADAVGLMQIMPQTALRLAKEVGINPFKVAYLFEPQKNIELGIKYLSDLGALFEKSPKSLGGDTPMMVYVIASYNAGEDAVLRWVKSSDAKNLEEFIEDIPYEETNDYVKKVLKTYWIYSELY